LQKSILHFSKGEKGIISDIITDELPLKLLEMGCLPGNTVMLVQVAPLGCPLYYVINDSHVAIRKEIAEKIFVETE
jgi:ferrous iron transport protein A